MPSPESEDEQTTVQGPDPERLAQAAELVIEASAAMTQAAGHIGADQPILDQARTAQDSALSALTEAIALLQDTSDQQQNGDQQQQQDGGNQQQQAEQARPEETPSQPDLARLLQGVRDREAQRQQQRAEGAVRRAYEPVGKDW
jgi:hypothetical protein